MPIIRSIRYKGYQVDIFERTIDAWVDGNVRVGNRRVYDAWVRDADWRHVYDTNGHDEPGHAYAKAAEYIDNLISREPAEG